MPDLEDTRKISVEIMNSDKEGTSSKKQENNDEKKTLKKEEKNKSGILEAYVEEKKIKAICKEIGSSKSKISSTSMLSTNENS